MNLRFFEIVLCLLKFLILFQYSYPFKSPTIKYGTMVLIERKVVLMRFTIISRPDDHSKEVSDYLRRRCEETGWKFDESDFELVLSVGGDGTLLRSIHEHLDKLDHISFVGIHTGTLGFLQIIRIKKLMHLSMISGKMNVI